ncbi:MAG TPA: 4'-phosphopantetheinyl transferase superfamily protein, partial [Paracoccaceae bacterium]|nr:4'-phosphopantetheinyl transferase superfamily protein [Paracoccaceae bacterium]
REFAAGRAAARAALAALGYPAAAIPMRPGRAPLWPPGIAGSLTHSATACLAAVTATPALIGLDIEPDEPLPADLIPLILTASEDRAQARLIFSAKESAWKAISPRVPQTPGFDAMSVTQTATAFTATLTQTLGPLPAGTRLQGRHTRTQGHILTALTLPPSSL